MDIVFRYFLIPGNVVDGPVRELIVVEDMDDDNQCFLYDVSVTLPDISSDDGTSNDISNVFFFSQNFNSIGHVLFDRNLQLI